MNIIRMPTTPGSSKYIVLDLETLNDVRLYNRYATKDPRPAPCRWPFRRVVSASIMEVTVTNGVWQVTDLRSWCGADDEVVVRGLFKWMMDRPMHRLVTYAGASEDVPVLKTASMEFGVPLPIQLRHLERDRLGWLHTDLAITLKGGAGPFVHQVELASRLGFPGKMAGSAGQVPHLYAEERFHEVSYISECDVILTALLMASHLASLGQVKSAATAHYVTMRYVRERRQAAIYHRELGNYLAKAEKQMMDEQKRWMKAS